MKGGRYATSRQKACLLCSSAKAKCDRREGSCTRCTRRGLVCTYRWTRPSGAPVRSEIHGQDGGPCSAPLLTSNALLASDSTFANPEAEPPIEDDGSNPHVELPLPLQNNTPTNVSSTTFTGRPTPGDSNISAIESPSKSFDTLDFSDMELFCPINADDISNRWLNSFVPIPGQRLKQYPPSVTTFISRILKSYAAVAVRGHGIPPFVHASQVETILGKTPLSTCLTLVRICEKRPVGGESVAVDFIEREMKHLYEHHAAFDDMSLLAAFQAYLIYSMVFFFILRQGTNGFLRQALMNLQSMASLTSRKGLMCTAEQQQARPKWEAWIVVEAKRRTLFTMYLLDSVLSAQDGLPTFLGTELEGLPAPANQPLWKAHTREGWVKAYNTHLVDWVEGSLHIDELWPVPPSFEKHDLSRREARVDLWLQNADEFGTMIYAVTSCTHGV